MPLQSILFDRLYYSLPDAIQWVEDHNMNAIKIHKTKRYYRFRQYKPLKYEHYRVVQVAQGIKYIIGFDN